MEPLDKIDQAPAHDPVDRWDRSAFDHIDQRLALCIVNDDLPGHVDLVLLAELVDRLVQQWPAKAPPILRLLRIQPPARRRCLTAAA